jgi:hypothetical protein
MLIFGWVAKSGSRFISPAIEFLSGFPSGGKTVMLRANFMTNLQSTNLATPAELGCSMPAEWETHAATWLGWPHNETDWPDKIDTIRWVYGEMVRKISAGELVRILVRNRAEQKLAASYLKRAGCDLKRVEFIVHPTNRGWTRDSGPVFVRRKHPTSNIQHPTSNTAIVHFHFNAWAKYDDWQKDTRVPETAARLLKKSLFNAQFNGRPRHRSERPRHVAHHRAMLSPPKNPGAESRPDQGAIRRDIQEISRRQKRPLVAQRPGRRRHARSH